jgi:hypothetical protein
MSKDNVVMEQDLLEAIKKHLPAQVCGLVKGRLEEADKMEKDLIDLHKDLDSVYESLKELRALDLDRQFIYEEKQKLKAERQNLTTSRHEWELAKELYEKDVQLAALRDSMEHVKQVNCNLTRNTIVRKQILGTDNIPVDGGSGGCGFVQKEPIDTTIEEEAE